MPSRIALFQSNRQNQERTNHSCRIKMTHAEILPMPPNPKSGAWQLFDFDFLLPVLWIVLALALTYSVWVESYREIERGFNVQSAALSAGLNDKLLSNEAVLEGFSSLLSAGDEINEAMATRYVQQMQVHYPHIYMLEIARMIFHHEIPELERSMVRVGYAGFKLHSVRCEQECDWNVSLNPQFNYYPLVFIYPALPGTERLLGLDLSSSPFLSIPLARSLKEERYVASEPFILTEGGKGYLMHRKAGKSGQFIALLAVNVDQLRDATTLGMAAGNPGLGFTLWHRGINGDAPPSLIMNRDQNNEIGLEKRFLPVLTMRKELGGTGQPFTLEVRHQLRLTDFNLSVLTALSIFNLGILAILIKYAFFRRQEAADKQIQMQQWSYLANHDSLTGLPNRLLLMDRLEMALRNAQRNKTLFAVIFMDINQFKQANDAYGHHVGDLVLKLVAGRIKASLRAVDSVARISGDEFVVVLGEVMHRTQAQDVGNKILATLPPFMEPEYPELSISLSMGIALYPEDGMDAEALIKLADQKMYHDKEQRKLRSVVITPLQFTADAL